MTRLPDAIGIGTRRCATSTIHHWLNEHPEIGKPPRGLHFFSEHYDRGLPWYRQQLAPHANRKTLVEVSVSYSYPQHAPQVLDRIADLKPGMRIFLSVRNPIERAFSDYLRSLRHCELPGTLSFGEAITRHPELLERGRYGTLLQQLLERFERRQICLLLYDDLREAPQRFASQLYRFLGVDARFEPPPSLDPQLGQQTVRWSLLNRGIYAGKRLADAGADRLGLQPWWTRQKRRGHHLYQRLLRWNTTASSPPGGELIPRLLDYYKSDIDSVERFTERTLAHWRAAA
jgi:hypothetical protein